MPPPLGDGRPRGIYGRFPTGVNIFPLFYYYKKRSILTLNAFTAATFSLAIFTFPLAIADKKGLSLLIYRRKGINLYGGRKSEGRKFPRDLAATAARGYLPKIDCAGDDEPTPSSESIKLTT